MNNPHPVTFILLPSYLVDPEKWLPAILSSVASKILSVNVWIYSYFTGSHDASASWWHLHVPHVDPEKWLPAILSSVASKILSVNVWIYSYFTGSHDASASWWHLHVPHVDPEKWLPAILSSVASKILSVNTGPAYIPPSQHDRISMYHGQIKNT